MLKEFRRKNVNDTKWVYRTMHVVVRLVSRFLRLPNQLKMTKNWIIDCSFFITSNINRNRLFQLYMKCQFFPIIIASFFPSKVTLISRRQQQSHFSCDCSCESSRKKQYRETILFEEKKICTAPPPFTTILASFQSRYSLTFQFVAFLLNVKFVSFVSLTLETIAMIRTQKKFKPISGKKNCMVKNF